MKELTIKITDIHNKWLNAKIRESNLTKNEIIVKTLDMYIQYENEGWEEK